MADEKECTCRLDDFITKSCVICNEEGLTESNPFDRHFSCLMHRSKGVSFCGFGEYVCLTCRDDGWYSTAGTGGDTFHFNRKTMKQKLPNGDIIDVTKVY